MRLIKYSFTFYLLGALPLVFLFFFNYMVPDSFLVMKVFSLAQGHARAISERYLVMSTIASSWTKLAPLFSFFLWFVIRKIPVKEYSTGPDVRKLLKALPPLLFFLGMMIFGYYCGDQDLSVGRNSLRAVSNDYVLLLLYYLASFLGAFSIGWFPLIFLVLLRNAVQHRN